MPDPRPKLVAIVGPTASGKTALAIDIAKRLDVPCEAINADSRQVYRHMDIGTAKPSPAELEALPHQLIDIAYPDEPFGLATWLDLANEALESAWGHGRLPIRMSLWGSRSIRRLIEPRPFPATTSRSTARCWKLVRWR